MFTLFVAALVVLIIPAIAVVALRAKQAEGIGEGAESV